MKHCYVFVIVIIMRKNVKKKNHTEQTKNNKPNFHLSIGQIKKKSAIISTIYRLEQKKVSAFKLGYPSRHQTVQSAKRESKNCPNFRNGLPTREKKVRPRVWSTEEGGGWGNGEAAADADGECRLSALNAFITILGKSRNAIVWPKWLFAPFMDLVVPLLGVYALGKQVKEAKVDCARLFFMPCFASWRFFN